MAWTYCITDRKTSEVPLLQQIRRVIGAGVDFLQIREKDLPARELYRLALQAGAMARGRKTRVLINDRLDIALAAELDGVHLAQASLPPDAVRSRVSKRGFLIGVSTHNRLEVDEALRQGADYLVFGPVFETPSKRPYGSPVTPQALGEVVRRSDRPVFALGGVDLHNYPDCLEQGAAGIAGIRLFQRPEPGLSRLVSAISSRRAAPPVEQDLALSAGLRPAEGGDQP